MSCGKCVKFNKGKLLNHDLKYCGLDQISKKSHIDFGSGLDGMNCWKIIGLKICAFKFQDIHGKNPLTKEMNIIVDEDENDTTKIQSPQNHIIWKCAVCKKIEKIT